MNTVQDLVRGCGFKHRDMENRVNTADGFGKSEGEGMGTGLSKDFERS